MARRRRRRDTPAPRRNPDLDTTDFTHKVVPGFGAYAATRFISRAAFTIADKKKSKMAKHIAAGASVAAAAAVWAFGERVAQSKPYYEPLLIGAGTAAVQGLVQAYLPQYGWLVGDLPKASAQTPVVAAGPSLNEMLKADDDLEAVPLMLYPGQTPPPGTVTQGQTRAKHEEEMMSDLSDYSEMTGAMTY